jgi:hypothetical protein
MLRYADSFSLTSSSGVVASYVFACNGLYDPNITGTGHQPAGFDQMMLSYEHYTVLRSRIVVEAVNTTGTSSPTVGLSIKANNIPITVNQQLLEDGLIVTERMGSAAVYGSQKCLKIACDIGRFGGVPNVLNDSDYRGNVASNPTEMSFFHIQSWSVSGDTTTILFEVVIEFEAVFTEPRTLSQSVAKSLITDFRRECKVSCAPTQCHPGSCKAK